MSENKELLGRGIITTDKNENEIDQTLVLRFQQAKNHHGSIEEFVREFLGSFISPQTKRAYITDLKTFFTFLHKGQQNIGHPQDIDAHHFQVYRDHMIESKLASATINRRLVAVRSFLKWALSCRLILNNPLDAIKLPKVSTENPTIAFDDDEAKQMIAQPDTTTKTGLAHRITLLLLFNLGLRRSELVNIKLKNFYQDRGHSVLKILGKGNKEREVPLSPILIEEINNYYDKMGTFCKSPLEPDDYLIQSRPKGKNLKPMDGSTVFRIVERYAKALGINKKVSPHSCRATVISHLLDTQKTPIRDVAIFAGHTNITTTERYDKRRKNLDTNAAYQVDFNKAS